MVAVSVDTFPAASVTFKVTPKVPVVENDALENGHDLAACYGYGNTLADSWFMDLCGHAVAVSPEGPLRRHAEAKGWAVEDWT